MKRKIFISVFCIGLLLISITPAMGDSQKRDDGIREDNTTESAQQLESMTVVDEAVPSREDLEIGSISNMYRIETSARFATEIFTPQDIQDLQPRDINDLLDKAVGINVTYQGRKSPYQIYQRGGGSFTYIVDGAVLPPSTNRILYKFPLASIEELKVIRGATSLSLGPTIPIGASKSGAGVNTGFIIIRTKQPRKTEATLTASIEKAAGGHPTAYTASLYAGTRMNVSSNGDAYIGGLISKMDRSSRDSWFDGQDSLGCMANAGYRFGKLSINVMGYKDEGRFEMQRGIDVDGILSDVRWYYDPLKITILSADGKMQWSPDQTTLINAFKTEYEQHEHNESFTNPGPAERDPYNEDTSGFGLRHNARFGNTLLQVGGQVSYSKGFGPNTSQGYNRYDTAVTGFSASVEQTLLKGDLVFDGGYRRDVKHIDNASSGKSQSAANDEANNDVDMAPSEVFALGAHWKMTGRVSLDGRYFHSDQGTSGDFDMRLVDDATPHAEKQERIEIALGADIAAFFNPVLTWFKIDTENEKSASASTYELDGATYYYYTESDELRQGLEVAIQGSIGKRTSYKVSWTRMLDNESTSDGVTTDAIGLSCPEDLFGLTLKHRWRAYRANLTVKQVDEWTNTRSAKGLAESGGLGGYTRVDANIARDFTFQDVLMSIAVFGRNLGDEHYSTRYVTGFYPDRGRTLGMELTFSY